MSTLNQPITSSTSTPKLIRKPMPTDRPNLQQVGPVLPKGTIERPYHIGNTRRDPELGSRPRSKAAHTTTPAFGSDLAAKPSADMSSRRRSQDARSLTGSIQSRADRSDSVTKSLFSRGTKLLKRQNSKSNLTSLRTLDWVEASYERDQIQELAGWRLLKHSRIDSTGSAKDIKQNISEPYNFQHLTHAHACQFQELERTRDNELVSEFSAIRASQAPRRELRGIKAQCLHSRNASSEALQQTSPTQSHTNSITPPNLSPIRSRNPMRDDASPSNVKDGKAVRLSPYIDNCSQRSPKFSKPTTPPMSPPRPPARVSSRAAFALFLDPSLSYQASPTGSTSEQSITGYSFATSDTTSALNSPMETTSIKKDHARMDPLGIGHAMTTPDDTALTLRPLPLSPPGSDLADVPEDDVSSYFKRSSVRHSRAGSAARHSRSHPSNLSGASASSHPSLGVLSETPGSPPCGSRTIDPTLPNMRDLYDGLNRPSVIRRISAPSKELDGCWEDDIDWCYEHAAEADCDFEWDCQSKNGDELTASGIAVVGATADACTGFGSGSEENADPLINQCGVPAPALVIAAGSNLCMPTSSSTSYLAIPELEPSSTDSAQSSAVSLPEALTHLQLRVSSHVTEKSTLKATASDMFTSPQPVYIPSDYEAQMMDEALYREILSDEYLSEHYVPLYNDSIDAARRFEDSPRSSHSPPSTCHSRESVIFSSAESLAKQRRENNSFSSLPELVHSKASGERFDIVATQLAEHIASLTTLTEATSSGQGITSTTQRCSQTLAKKVAHQTILKKANSCGNLLDCRAATAPAANSSPSPHPHHGRAQSEAATRILDDSLPQPARPSTLKRVRSAGAGNLLGKSSYTLFPATSVKTSS
ncbi:hypothetical protein MMC08_007600 [Hypocenomyce scalaris]|nr:hypothetical protein [Hypocenomyce scalaris]